MLKKLSVFGLLSATALAFFAVAGAALARPGCPHQACHDPLPPGHPPTTRPAPNPQPDPDPPLESDCIDADGDGEEDDDCQSVEREGFMDPGTGAPGGGPIILW